MAPDLIKVGVRTIAAVVLQHLLWGQISSIFTLLMFSHVILAGSRLDFSTIYDHGFVWSATILILSAYHLHLRSTSKTHDAFTVADPHPGTYYMLDPSREGSTPYATNATSQHQQYNLGVVNAKNGSRKSHHVNGRNGFPKSDHVNGRNGSPETEHVVNDRSVKSCKFKIIQSVRESRWEDALRHLSKMHLSEPGFVMCSQSVMSACVRGGEWTKAVQILADVQQSGAKPDVVGYTTGIHAYSKMDMWGAALQLLSCMRERGVTPNTQTYSAAIDACARGCQWPSALELLSRMAQEGLPIDTVAYSAGINACAKAAQWEVAIRLLNDMQVAGVVPNVASFGSAINACAKGNQWQLAMRLLQKMRNIGVDPNVQILTATMDSCVKSRQWRLALAILSSFETYGLAPTHITCHVGLEACAKGGDWRTTLKILDELRRGGHVIKLSCYNAAMRAFGKCEILQRALDLLEEMRAKDITPGSAIYRAYIGTHAATHRAAVSHNVRDQERESYSDRKALNLFIGLRQRGMTLDVRDLYAAIDECSAGRM
jgi:pentatricopeptide repeat protein